MYNRYIPSADGTYKRQIVAAEKAAREEIRQPAPKQEKTVPVRRAGPAEALPRPDTGDILVLLILLLILTEGEDADATSVLIALAAFFLMQ